MSLLWFFVSFYIFINYFISKWIYKMQLIYYKPVFVTDENDPNSKPRNLHDDYPAFKRYDKESSFLRIFLGVNLFFWIRIILSVFIITLCWLSLKYVKPLIIELWEWFSVTAQQAA
jgi:hypothetical protein